MADAPVQHRVLITLLARDLRFPELRTLFREVRSHLGIVRQQRLSEKDRLLINMVRGLGGPPERPTSSIFWNKVLKAWNREYAQWQVGNPRTLSKRYAKATPEVGKVSVPVAATEPGEIRVTGTGMQMDLRKLAALKQTPEFKKAQKTARALTRFVSTLVSQQAEGGRRSQQMDRRPLVVLVLFAAEGGVVSRDLRELDRKWAPRATISEGAAISGDYLPEALGPGDSAALVAVAISEVHHAEPAGRPNI